MRSLIPITGSLITPPRRPAVTVDRARRHIRALDAADDVLVASWIVAATQSFEEYTGRQVITATREWWLDCFPGYGGATGQVPGWNKIELPNPPLQSVSSILYVAGDGTLASFSDGGSPDTPFYSAKTPQGPHCSRGWVEPLFGQAWPTTQYESGAARIQYVCGYGDSPDDVPDLVTAAICFLVAHYDRNRLPVQDQSNGSFAEVPLTVRSTFDAFKYSAYPSQLPRTTVFGAGV